MGPPPSDDLRDLDLDGACSTTKTRWRGCTVEVTARLVPRYLWSTASIDVHLDGRCILRTGGQRKIVGSSTAEFQHDGESHTVALSWDQVRSDGFAGLSFPFHLSIDDAKVAASEVPVENPQFLFVSILSAFAVFVFWLFSLYR